MGAAVTRHMYLVERRLFDHLLFSTPPTFSGLSAHLHTPPFATPLRGLGLVACHTPFIKKAPNSRSLLAPTSSSFLQTHNIHRCHSLDTSKFLDFAHTAASHFKKTPTIFTLPTTAHNSTAAMLSIPVVAAAAGLLQAAAATDVFAHFMVQNSYAYDVDQWKTDMKSAQQMGIDGFALNWIPPDCQAGLSWMPDRIGDAYTAAEQMGFSLMQSFDMSYSSCYLYWNQTYMADEISKYSGSSAAYRWNSNMLVSTYGGDQVDEYGNEFFQGLKDNMKSYNPISLAPALTQYSLGAWDNPSSSASSLMSDYPSIDGYLNWQAWPLDSDRNMTITADEAFSSAIKSNGRSGPYIMGKSRKGHLARLVQADNYLSGFTMAVQGSQRRQPTRRLGRLQRYADCQALRVPHGRQRLPARHH